MAMTLQLRIKGVCQNLMIKKLNLKFLRLFSVLLLLFISLAGFTYCNMNSGAVDSGDGGDSSHNNIIYLAGSYQMGTVYVASYWEDNDGSINKIDLIQDVTESEAKEIYVDNESNIHIAGVYDDKPVYWLIVGEQITMTQLSSTNQSEANTIFVSENYVFIAGKTYNGSKDVAVYWKINRSNLSDIEEYEATDGSMNAYINSIYVYNNDVYLAGRYQSSTEFISCYWKHSGDSFTTVDLETSVDEAEATDIYIENDVIYVVGKYVDATGYYIAGYWKGTEGNLTDYSLPEGHVNGAPSSIYIYNGVVYIGGNYQNESQAYTTTAAYWKDDGGEITLVSLTDGITTDSYVKSVFVNDNGVYCGGYTLPQLSTSVATYWLTEQDNTTDTSLNDGSYRAKIYSVYVVN